MKIKIKLNKGKGMKTEKTGKKNRTNILNANTNPLGRLIIKCHFEAHVDSRN